MAKKRKSQKALTLVFPPGYHQQPIIPPPPIPNNQPLQQTKPQQPNPSKSLPYQPESLQSQSQQLQPPPPQLTSLQVKLPSPNTQLAKPYQPGRAQRSIITPLSLTAFSSLNNSTVSVISAQLSTQERLPTPTDRSNSGRSDSSGDDVTAALQELHLLNDASLNSRGQSRDHELRTAPIYTRDAYTAAAFGNHVAQYGVLGKAIQIYSKTSSEAPQDPRLYVNTNAPFSAIVCGVQGSGKSHTVSVLLENMFISKCPHIGTLEKPLCGLVLHFGEGGPSSRPCEASWVGVPSFHGIETPPVRVYVSRSSLNTMRAVYAPLGPRVIVEPLFFSEAELDAESFLSMMAVGSSESAPLYVQLILSILRDLGENYTFREFMARLEECKMSFNPAQLTGLEQRMALLTSFMNPNAIGLPQNCPRFAAGQLTIIDLSDPFIDSASACGLFEIITRLFVRADVGTGKVLVVDEAHKYLSSNKGCSGLKNSLLTLTREQRHLAMRVIISTQEPTVVPPVLLDLCTVAILHRFSSPSWWEHVSHHVSADVSEEEAFDKVVRLQTGEAIVLAPSGLSVVQEEYPSGLLGLPTRKLDQLGRRYMLMKTRNRVTADGGASILVLDS